VINAPYMQATNINTTNPTQSGEPTEGIVYDVGANNGDDTEYYLKKGLKVVAIEASLFQVGKIVARLGEEIQNGNLIVLNIAVGNVSGKAKFYVNIADDKRSSLIYSPDCIGQWIEKDVEV